MLIVCPNCATSYGVEMASLRLASGWTRKLRCQRCRWVWQAQLSDTDKLWSRRMQCRRYGAPWPLSPKLRPMRRERRCRACGEPRQFWLMTDRMPTRPAGSPAEPVGAKPARATVTPPSQRISAGLPGSSALSGNSPGGARGGYLGGGLDYGLGYDLGDYRGGGGGRHCHVCSALFSDLR